MALGLAHSLPSLGGAVALLCGTRFDLPLFVQFSVLVDTIQIYVLQFNKCVPCILITSNPSLYTQNTPSKVHRVLTLN